jgi:glycosyltransferase involved in cell wall biosynthesis
MAMAIAHNGGLIPKNCIVVPNGVDLDEYRPNPSKQSLLRKQLGLSGDTLVFGSCAGLANHKRVDLAIAAGARVTSSRPFVILAICEEEAGLQLQRMAEQAGSVRFKYCGFYRDVKEFIPLFDVGFVLSDTIETTSFAAREMMSMGKPLITSSYGGLRENITDGQNGILTRPSSVDDVIAGMERFLGMSPQELTQFSANARSYAEKNFDVKRQIQLHRSIYQDLLSLT